MSAVQKGQVSFEFLMVTGVALFILAAATYFMFGYTQTSSEKSALQQAAQVGYRIVDQAQNMYVYGEGSFVTVTANLPEQIDAVYTVDNNTLVLDVQSTRGTITVPVFSDVPINGTRIDANKTHVNNDTLVVHSGHNQYRVESQGEWVLIKQVA